MSNRTTRKQARAAVFLSTWGLVKVAGRLVGGDTTPTFSDVRMVEKIKAGYVSQVKAERDRARFPRKRK